MNSEKFEKVKTYYKNGFWTKSMVQKAVLKSWITVNEYEEITNEKYE